MRDLLVISASFLLAVAAASAQAKPDSPQSAKASPVPPTESAIPLNSISTRIVPSEMGGAFMFPQKCDEDGNLFIRKFATDRPMLGPVVKIAPDGKRSALFDPIAFSQLNLDRADTFEPASDGGLYQIAQEGIAEPQTYVLHFSSDGSPSTPVHLDGGFDVYAFAPFAGGNFLISGVQRDPGKVRDAEHRFAAIFSSDGRLHAALSFATDNRASHRPSEAAPDTLPPGLALSTAEAGSDGNLYVMRSSLSSGTTISVVSPDGAITRTLRIAAPAPDVAPSVFHLSGNRLAVSFWNDKAETQWIVVADAQNGRKIATYSVPPGVGPSFACYSAN